MRSLLLLSLAALASASKVILQSPRFTITSSKADVLRDEPLSVEKLPTTPLELSPTDTLKVTFQLLNRDNGRGVQPHQTFLRFYDKETDEEGIQPVRVSSSGKAKFELNMARPPTSIPPTTTSPLRVTLIVGSFTHSPLKVDLFDLILPPSHPATEHPDEASYHALPTITHTFRTDQKLPPSFISAVFTLSVIAPWVVLAGLLSYIRTPTPNLFSPSILPFISTLGAFEALLVWYWIDLKLGQVLFYGAILGVIAVFTGNRALASIADTRMYGKKTS